jgi:Protein of unknown function (DUF3224)
VTTPAEANQCTVYDGCMHASGTFKVVAFAPASIAVDPAVPAGLPTAALPTVVAATLEKQYEGAITGHSATLFAADCPQGTEVGACAASRAAAEVGACVAMEAFEGTVDGRDGAFDFAHSTTGDVGAGGEQSIRIVPASGTGLLAGIHGTGGMAIDADGTHRIWFDYELG